MSVVAEFPVHGILPRKETGAFNFLNKYPEYDGRGIKIAILDTGIDPGAPGMKVTSDGKPKVIDCYDTSGSGDVDTSTIISPVDGFLTGLSGRKIKVPDSWNNPTGQYHIGSKELYLIYPKPLKERIQKEFKEKVWDPPHRNAIADNLKALEAYEAQASKDPTQDQQWEHEDLKSRVELLRSIDSNANLFKSFSPILDCIVWHDGTQWNAVVDTTEGASIESCVVLTNYRDCLKYGTFSDNDMCNYTVNIYEDGNLLEIVVGGGAHATHVGGIAAGNFPDVPEQNGVAPGAQLVSFKVGDTRLGTMETGTSFIRAVNKAVELGCDLINYSYGEACHVNDAGRMCDAVHEAVHKHGVVFVSSAGNNGPGLSSSGCPGSSSSACIGIGAWVSPEMMAAEYSLPERLPANFFTWSSRGPTPDGALGACIAAPGGAITSVPQWTLRGYQLMNGTSMSSPNACGCLALVMSGLKDRGIRTSPWQIRRALENRALRLDGMERFAQGYGLIQVEPTFDFLTEFVDPMERDVFFSIKVGQHRRGIYLREPHETRQPSEHAVTVEPSFTEWCSQEAKIAFTLRLAMSADASWLQVPGHLLLTNMARVFPVRVDPRGLTPGAHFTEILAYDVACPQRGAIFRIPVTVLIPTRLDAEHPALERNGVAFRSGAIQRDFLAVPPGATWADIRLRVHTRDQPTKFMLHAIQLRDQDAFRTHHFDKFITIPIEGVWENAFPLLPNNLLELCVARFWSSLGETMVDYRLNFHSLDPRLDTLLMHSCDGVKRVDVIARLGNEELAPVVSLTHLVEPLRPSEHKIVCLSRQRDCFADSRQRYAVDLGYPFAIHGKPTEVMVECPLLSHVLYESPYESQLWMIFEKTKCYIGAGDAYPNQYKYTLGKGDYVVRMRVTHEKREALERLKDMPLLLHQKLPSGIALDVHWQRLSAILPAGPAKCSPTQLVSGASVPFFIAPLTDDKIPKGCSAGSFLFGTLTLAKNELAKRASGVPMKYVFGEMPSKANAEGKKPKSGPAAADAKKDAGLVQAMRDLKISWIPKSGDDEVYNELRQEHADHVALHVARLRQLEVAKDWEQAVQVARVILGLIKKEPLLEYIGTKSPARDPAVKNTMEEERLQLVDTCVTAGCILADHLVHTEERSQEALAELDLFYNTLLSFFEPIEPKAIKLSYHHSLAHGHAGRALKYAFKMAEHDDSHENHSKCLELFTRLGWLHCASLYRSWLLVKYPLDFTLF